MYHSEAWDLRVSDGKNRVIPFVKQPVSVMADNHKTLGLRLGRKKLVKVDSDTSE